MQKADIALPMKDVRYPGVKAGILNWPVSAVRLVGRSSQQMQTVANNILTAWREYSDESVGILAHTGDTPHNTVTPILHYDETDGYILDLALRNNRTTEQYPDGIFHPHKEYHNIKKENIGLIEVMGLAVLPSRLKDELTALAEALVEGRDITADEMLGKHAAWVENLKRQYTITDINAMDILMKETGKVFADVLEDAGVYKNTADGKAAFRRFIDHVNQEE